MTAKSFADLAEIAEIPGLHTNRSVRQATGNLVKSLGLCVIVFASAEEFLESPRFDDVSCIISDIQMPGMNGLELQQHLALAGPERPLIFITAFLEERFRQQAMEAGAIGFFTKPFEARRLIECIARALATSFEIVGPVH
jgi:FixJ family two-component response regulator